MRYYGSQHECELALTTIHAISSLAREIAGKHRLPRLRVVTNQLRDRAMDNSVLQTGSFQADAALPECS